MKILTVNTILNTQYFKDKGLDIEVTNISISKVFPMKFLYNVKDQGGNLVPLYTPDVAQYLEKTYPKKEYSIIMVGWDSKDYDDYAKNTGGYSCPIPLSNGTLWCTVRNNDEQSKHHEMMHCLANIVNLFLGDRTPKDFMDTTPVNGQWFPYYLNDYTSKDPLSNYNQTWRGIMPFIDKLNNISYGSGHPLIRQGSRGEFVKELQTILGVTADGIFGKITDKVVKAFQASRGLTVDGIVGKNTWTELLKKKPNGVTITRISDNGTETLGELVAYKDGKEFRCKTIELAWKENKNNISCIPKGTYEVAMSLWSKKNKNYYLLKDVPSRSGIFIHEGNYYYNYEGCIGLGKDFADINKDGQTDITSTVATLNAFEKFMNKEPFTLTIQ